MESLFKSKLVFCYFGNGIALGSYGSKEHVDYDLDGLYNWGGHKDDTTYLSDGFGYVLTTKDKLKHGISNLLMTKTFDYCADKPRGETRKKLLETVRKAANLEAHHVLLSIPQENFLQTNEQQINELAIPFK